MVSTWLNLEIKTPVIALSNPDAENRIRFEDSVRDLPQASHKVKTLATALFYPEADDGSLMEAFSRLGLETKPSSVIRYKRVSFNNNAPIFMCWFHVKKIINLIFKYRNDNVCLLLSNCVYLAYHVLNIFLNRKMEKDAKEEKLNI